MKDGSYWWLVMREALDCIWATTKVNDHPVGAHDISYRKYLLRLELKQRQSHLGHDHVAPVFFAQFFLGWKDGDVTLEVV